MGHMIQQQVMSPSTQTPILKPGHWDDYLPVAAVVKSWGVPDPRPWLYNQTMAPAKQECHSAFSPKAGGGPGPVAAAHPHPVEKGYPERAESPEKCLLTPQMAPAGALQHQGKADQNSTARAQKTKLKPTKVDRTYMLNWVTAC